MPPGPSEIGPFFMRITCDQCGKANQGKYKTFWYEFEEGEKQLVTLCYECLGDKLGSGRTDKQMFEHISTPFWIHAGLPPKPKEKLQMKYLKDRNMTWGDLRREKYAKMPMTNQGLKDFEEHRKKYGRGNAPDVKVKKKSN